MKAEWIVKEIAKGLLKWYSFQEGSRILYIGDERDACAEMFRDMNVILDICKADQLGNNSNVGVLQYDYVVSIASLELIPDLKTVLIQLKGMVKSTGHILLGMNNRLGIRYFCGDRDPYTRRNFDGIEDYRRMYAKKEDSFRGRCYDKAYIEGAFEEAGLKNICFSVFSDLQNPVLLLRDDYMSNEDLAIRILPTYNYPGTVFLEEEFIYNALIKNNMLHAMANAFLFECTMEGELSDALQITSSMGRAREDAFLTVVRDSKVVDKIPAYEEGRERLERILDHHRQLESKGISVVPSGLADGVLRMPYIEAETGQSYLQRLIRTDIDLFYKELDCFKNLVLQSSEPVEGEEQSHGTLLKNAYVDMIPLNSFYIDGKFVFYDQEFCFENYPAEPILTRLVESFGMAAAEPYTCTTLEELYDRYGLKDNLEEWHKMNGEFLSNLRKEKELRKYFEKTRRDFNKVNSNRQRMNYSSEDYQRKFINIFDGLEYKQIVLFGTGNFAQRFMELYGSDYSLTKVVDNNPGSIGETFWGVPIERPEILQQLECGTYRVIVCIKNYVSVIQQLDDMNISDYCIYDPNQEYPRKLHMKERETVKPSRHHKYHVGYIAGVFDLFHVGHLEKFKLAKEQCDYLIVGVVTDEGVRRFKKVEPVVPFEERAEMIRGCRYVDEVVKIPENFGSTTEAWKMFRFDVQFSGSDYADNPDWLVEKEFLRQHGADMVFFPYTEATSSTKLRKLIDKQLLG